MGTFGRTCASSASLRLLALVDVPICTPPRARIARLASETPARPHMNSADSAGAHNGPSASSASLRPPRIRTVLRARSGWRSASLRLTTDNCLVSPVGIEPTTNWLKASCSTTELRARFYSLIPMMTPVHRPSFIVHRSRSRVKNGRAGPEIA